VFSPILFQVVLDRFSRGFDADVAVGQRRSTRGEIVNRIVWSGIVASLAMLLPATALATRTNTVTAVDGTGRTITLSKPATRITCVYGASCWGILAALGLKPTASTPADSDMAAKAYFGSAAQTIPTIVWNSVESVASSRPNLIIARQGNTDLVQSESVVAPVFLTANFNVNGIAQSTIAIGRLTGRVAQATASIAAFRTTMKKLEAKRPAGSLKKVAIEEAWSTNSYIVEWSSNPVCEAMAKYRLAYCPFPATGNAAEATAPESEFDPEFVLQQNPDVFAFVGYPGAPNFATRNDPVWGQLSAVKSGNVFQDDHSYALFGQSLVGIEYASEEILHRLYPTVYRDPGNWYTWTPNTAT
jgi:ABC-type Fe3+-hydroxamate transport system substrate-binding protein